MGLADRNYDQRPQRSRGAMPQITPAVKALMAINICVFILDHLVFVSKPPNLPPNQPAAGAYGGGSPSASARVR